MLSKSNDDGGYFVDSDRVSKSDLTWIIVTFNVSFLLFLALFPFTMKSSSSSHTLSSLSC